eukprot:Awhi_evm3s327
MNLETLQLSQELFDLNLSSPKPNQYEYPDPLLDISSIDISITCTNMTTNGVSLPAAESSPNAGFSNLGTSDSDHLSSNPWQIAVIGSDLSIDVSLHSDLSYTSPALTSLSDFSDYSGCKSVTDSFDFSNSLFTASQSLPSFQMDYLSSFSNLNPITHSRRVSVPCETSNFLDLKNFDSNYNFNLENNCNTLENSFLPSNFEIYSSLNMTNAEKISSTSTPFFSKDHNTPVNLSTDQKKKLKKKKPFVKKY